MRSYHSLELEAIGLVGRTEIVLPVAQIDFEAVSVVVFSAPRPNCNKWVHPLWRCQSMAGGVRDAQPGTPGGRPARLTASLTLSTKVIQEP